MNKTVLDREDAIVSNTPPILRLATGDHGIVRVEDPPRVTTPLRILLLENIPLEAELTLQELRQANIPFTVKRVATEKKFRAELIDFLPNIVLAEYSLPQFSGLEALRIVREQHSQLPFILVTGPQREEVAVRCMQEGADDYILKSSLRRLPSSILNALQNREVQRERVTLESELQKSAKKVIAVFESITDAFFAVDKQWRFLYLNKSSDKLLGKAGKERETLWGQNWWNEFPTSSDSKSFRELTRAMTENVAVEFEEFYASLNSWLYVRAYPAEDGLSIYAQDITERKQSDELLASTERRYRAIIENNLDAIALVDREGIIEYLSPSAESVLGYTEQELLGTTVFACVHPDDVLHLTERFGQVVRNNREVVQTEGRFRHTNGSWRWIELIGKSLLDDPSLRSIVVTYRDITGRKRTEEKIREQARLLDIAQDAIIVRDLLGVITFWNKGAERIYGWKAEEVLEKNAAELFGETLPQETLNEVLKKGAWFGELIQQTNSNQQVVVESRWTLVKNDDGTPKSILIINTDITEKKQLSQQFVRAQRLENIGTLAGGIAHDLKNVLTPILMAIPILKEKLTDRALFDILETMKISANRGVGIVNQVLSFAASVEGERVLIQMKHLIVEIVRFLRETLPPSIRIQTKITRDVWLVAGDTTQLYQVLMNLAINARDAMPHGGELLLEVRNATIDVLKTGQNAGAQPGNYVVVTVSDTGMGMKAELMEKIFEPFFTTKAPGKGTGLGLFTVQSIVKNHGGFLTMQSEVGKGTAAMVYLPATEKEFVHLPVEERIIPMGQGQLVLVIDDEISICHLIRATLESANYKVLTARDGVEALALYVQRRHEINAVFVDMLMPVMDGPTTARALKRIDPNIAIIAMSGSSEEERKAAGMDFSGLPFLQKPIKSEEMLFLLQEILLGVRVTVTNDDQSLSYASMMEGRVGGRMGMPTHVKECF